MYAPPPPPLYLRLVVLFFPFTKLHKHHIFIVTTISESSRGAMDMGRRSRQAVGEEEEDRESQVVPSFQSAFNEALLSASVSVIAAQSGKSLSYDEVW